MHIENKKINGTYTKYKIGRNILSGKKINWTYTRATIKWVDLETFSDHIP